MKTLSINFIPNPAVRWVWGATAIFCCVLSAHFALLVLNRVPIHREAAPTPVVPLQPTAGQTQQKPPQRPARPTDLDIEARWVSLFEALESPKLRPYTLEQLKAHDHGREATLTYRIADWSQLGQLMNNLQQQTQTAWDLQSAQRLSTNESQGNGVLVLITLARRSPSP